MSFDVVAYVDQLFKGSNLDEERLEIIKEALTDEQVAETLKDSVLMRSDYSRRMDELRNKEQELANKLDAEERLYSEMIEKDHNNASRWEELQQEVEQLKAQGGTMDYNYGDGVSKVELQKALGEMQDSYNKRLIEIQRNALGVIADTTKLVHRHAKEFGEELDPMQLYNYALENNLPVDHAYNVMTQDRRQQIVEQRREEELKRAREEGAREALSKHNLPLVDTRQRGIHSLFAPKGTPINARERVGAAVAAYMRGD